MSYLPKNITTPYEISVGVFLPTLVVIDNAKTGDPSKYEVDTGNWLVFWYLAENNVWTTQIDSISCVALVNRQTDLSSEEKASILSEIDFPD